jgi:hypothetical protein
MVVKNGRPFQELKKLLVVGEAQNAFKAASIDNIVTNTWLHEFNSPLPHFCRRLIVFLFDNDM